MMEKIEDLGKSEMKLLLLLYMKNGKEEYITNLVKALKSPSQLEKSINVLMRRGLVRVEKRGRRKYVILSEKGKRVAKNLYEIFKIL